MYRRLSGLRILPGEGAGSLGKVYAYKSEKASESGKTDGRYFYPERHLVKIRGSERESLSVMSNPL